MSKKPKKQSKKSNEALQITNTRRTITCPGDSDLNQIFATLKLECRLCTRKIWIYLIFLMIPIIGFTFVKLSGTMSENFLKPVFDEVLSETNVFGNPFKFRPNDFNLPKIQNGVYKVTDNIEIIPNKIIYHSTSSAKENTEMLLMKVMDYNITYFDKAARMYKEKEGIVFLEINDEDDMDEEIYDSLHDEEFEHIDNVYLGGYLFEEVNDHELKYTILNEHELERKTISVSVQSVLREMRNNYTSTSSFCRFAGLVEQSFECQSLMGSVLMNSINSAYIFDQTNSISQAQISHFPYDSEGFGFKSDIAGDYRAVLWLPIMFGAVLLINVNILISDKEKGHRSLMSLMGLRTRNYKIAKYITLLSFYFVYAYTLYIYGRFILNFRIFTMTSFWIWFFVFLGHGLCLTSFSFLLSSPFRSSHASMVPCLIIGFAAPRVLGMLDEQISIKGTLNLLPLEVIYPFQFVDTTIQLLEQTVIQKVYLDFDFLFKDLNIGVSICCMYFFSVVYFMMGLYLEKVFPQHGMVRKSPFFVAKKVFYCVTTPCRIVCCVVIRKFVCGIIIKTVLSTILKELGVIDHDIEFDDEYDQLLYDQEMDEAEKKRKNELDEDVIEEARIIENMNPSEVNNYGIVVNGLKKRYTRKGKLVVNDLSFRVGKDELFGLLGENGAGKTTSIRMLIGELSITGGKAWIYGKNVSKNTQYIRRSIGVCPQHDILFPELTAREHLSYYAAVRGINVYKRAKHIEELMIQTELLDADHIEKAQKDCSVLLSCFNWFCNTKEQKVRNLSAGERRRLSLAISLIGNPKTIFLDEPTTGLGPQVKRHIWAIIEKLKKNKSIVLTTHSMEEADYLCDRVGIMAKGEFKCIGTSVKLKNKFGRGYRLKVIYEDKKNRKEVMKFINSLISKKSSERRITLDFADTLIWEISQKNLSVSHLINSIEEHKVKYGIKDWSLNQATLKDVFLYLVSEKSGNKQIEDLEKEIKRLKDDLQVAEKKITQMDNFDASDENEDDDINDDSTSSTSAESNYEEENTDSSDNDDEEEEEEESEEEENEGGQEGGANSSTSAEENNEESNAISEDSEDEESEEKEEEEESEDDESDNNKNEEIIIITEEEKKHDSEEDSEDTRNKQRKKRKIKKLKKKRVDREKYKSPVSVNTIRKKFAIFVSQFFVLFRKEVNLARRNLVISVSHVLFGSLLVIALFVLFSFGTINDSKTFYESELISPIYSCQTFEEDGVCYQFIYTLNNNPFGKEIISFMTRNYKEIKENEIKEFETTDHMKNWIISNPNRTISALSFTNTTKNKMNPMINQVEYTVYYNSSSLDQATGDLKPIVLRLQQIVDEAILNLRQGYSNIEKRIKINLKSFPMYELKEKPAIYDVFNHYGPPFFCTMVVFVIIYATNDFISQKSIGFHSFLKTSGLKPLPICLSYSVFFILFGLIDVLLVFLVGFFVGIPIVKETNFLIFTGLFLLFFLTLLSALTIFLPFMKNTSDVAAFISFIVFIFFYVCSLFDVDLLYATYIQTEDSWIAWVLLYIIIPPLFSPINFCKIFADMNFLAIPIFDFDEKRFDSNIGFGFNHLFVKNTHEELGLETEMTALWIGYLVINIIVYLSIGLLIQMVCFSRVYNIWDYIGNRKYREPRKRITTIEEAENNKDKMLIIDNIKKNYNNSVLSKLTCSKKNKVLNKVELKVKKNELVCILGHNSAGKTSLMNLISGLNRITKGNIYVDQKSVKISPSSIQKNLGIVNQYDILIPKLTAAEHLEIFALAKGVEPHLIPGQIEYALKKVGLDNFANAYAGTFSGGMKRRLSVAITMMGNTNLILADEPTTGVDPYSCYKICKLLYDRKKDNSILMSSHDMEEAELLSDRIAILHNKKIQCFASPLELKARYDTGYTLSILVRLNNNNLKNENNDDVNNDNVILDDIELFETIEDDNNNNNENEEDKYNPEKEFEKFIEEYLPQSELKKKSMNFYVYQIERRHLKELSVATRKLEELEKQDRLIEEQEKEEKEEMKNVEYDDDEFANDDDLNNLQIKNKNKKKKKKRKKKKEFYKRQKSFVLSWGINQCTLEDVYLKVTLDDYQKKLNEKKKEEEEENEIIEDIEERVGEEEEEMEIELRDFDNFEKEENSEESDEESNTPKEKESEVEIESILENIQELTGKSDDDEEEDNENIDLTVESEKDEDVVEDVVEEKLLSIDEDENEGD